MFIIFRGNFISILMFVSTSISIDQFLRPSIVFLKKVEYKVMCLAIIAWNKNIHPSKLCQ